MFTDRTPTRRTVITAGAWSLPVIAMAVATPAAAASASQNWAVSDFVAYMPMPGTGQPDYIAIGATLTNLDDPDAPAPPDVSATYTINDEAWDAELGYIVSDNTVIGGGTRPDGIEFGESISITATFSMPDGSTVLGSGTAVVSVAPEGGIGF
ncbi:hypothetical protein [Paramicrobacterium chengjingii]|uniref:hypothetical protein n=1 Tax=Paramicrobacterium chengjingii TaxID=2769067 RepID=UPI00141D77D4|nr:hypothetical protein [Microbacterium chengjingii]